jgi:hypothetical protein
MACAVIDGRGNAMSFMGILLFLTTSRHPRASGDDGYYKNSLLDSCICGNDR